MAEPCPFFDKLPAEMRNDIYELAFTPASIDEPVHLPNATPPSKSLLLVSKQVHSEAKNIYRRAYRDYWSKTDFYISGKEAHYEHWPQKLSFTAFVPWSAIDIDHISTMTLKFESCDSVAVWTAQLLDKHGRWEAKQFSKHAPGLQQVYRYHLIAQVDIHGQVRIRKSYSGLAQSGFSAPAGEISLYEQLRAILEDCF